MILTQLRRRKLARLFVVLAVAFAAGHLVQAGASRGDEPAMVAAEIGKPVNVVTLAADRQPKRPPVAIPSPDLAAVAPAPVMPELVTIAEACPVTFDVMAQPGAMLGLTLIAPCQPNTRVVLRHAGRAITATTTATGALFLDLPGLASDGAIEVMLPAGETFRDAAALPDLGQIRRFAVQWQADDAFQLNVIETDAGIETHVSAAKPQTAPLGGVVPNGGYLTLLGDGSTDLPLLAAIYTFSADAGIAADVVVEAAVTPATCARELLAETLMSMGGAVIITDLSLAMPECDAIGDFLVLNNLVPDLKIAAAD